MVVHLEGKEKENNSKKITPGGSIVMRNAGRLLINVLMLIAFVAALANCGGGGGGGGDTAKTGATYTVIYDGHGNDGGNVPIDTTKYKTGQTVMVLSGGDLAKSNYTYMGWNTKADGTGTTYIEGDTFTMGSANVTLYAKWTPTVTISGNISLPAPLTADKCYVVIVDDLQYAYAYGTGLATSGTSTISYTIDNVPVGQWDILAYVDIGENDLIPPDCNGWMTDWYTGNYMGDYGGTPDLNAAVESSGANTFDITVSAIP
jgi:uncharacterized repeat protein (TIGR02543 family)